MAWLRENGWWLPHGASDRPTHLLLDGGKARVPDDSAGLFLQAYTLAVVRKQEPCVVELRTPVFRMFLDLDIKVAQGRALDFDAAMAVLQRRATAFFAEDEPRAVVCATDPKPSDDGVKSGKHVVWTNLFVTTATALAFRAALLEDLEAALPGACVKPWSTVVDACVFTSNGLRMPFSGKGRGVSSVYTPVAVWVGDKAVEAVEAVHGVSAVRRWVDELSIRAFGKEETAVRDGVQLPEAVHSSSPMCGVTQSLQAYEAVLPLLDAALPPQFAGQRFTGLIKADSCFMLRSSSRYCLNLGRNHNSCGVYFILTCKGIRQGCYCRCDTTEGRRYGQCRDFKSDVWAVPDEALAAFFGADLVGEARVKEAGFVPHPLPSRKVDILDRLACSRPCLVASRRGGKRCKR